MAVEPVRDTISRTIDNAISRRIDIAICNSVHDAVRVPAGKAVYLAISFAIDAAIRRELMWT